MHSPLTGPRASTFHMTRPGQGMNVKRKRRKGTKKKKKEWTSLYIFWSYSMMHLYIYFMFSVFLHGVFEIVFSFPLPIAPVIFAFFSSSSRSSAIPCHPRQTRNSCVPSSPLCQIVYTTPLPAHIVPYLQHRADCPNFCLISFVYPKSSLLPFVLIWVFVVWLLYDSSWPTACFVLLVCF